MSFDQALQVITRNGGSVSEKSVSIKTQQPVPVRLEQSFEGMRPVSRIGVGKLLPEVPEIKFEGTGIVLRGNVESPDVNYVAEVEFFLDGQSAGVMSLPANFTLRAHDLFWKYQLDPKEYTLTFTWLNPAKDAKIHVADAIIYGEALVSVED